MPEPLTPAQLYEHDDGRACYVCRYWLGSPQKGSWQQDYFYRGDGGWRFCGRHHD